MLLSYEHEFHDNEFWYALAGAEQKDVNKIDMDSFCSEINPYFPSLLNVFPGNTTEHIRYISQELSLSCEWLNNMWLWPITYLRHVSHSQRKGLTRHA